jgi:peptidoglycan L-alanyl-D-glutamate endopeptidase CwlK
MSAGLDSVPHQPLVDHDLGKLAPAFRAAVEASLADCQAMKLDAVVFEALRSEALQSVYYARGRTQIPPEHTVTNAKSALFSWHGYGLAVDVISASDRWNARPSWWAAVAAVFKGYGCSWGGDWEGELRDLPHFQWGLCPASPAMRTRAVLSVGGLSAVWSLYGADHN